MPSLNLQLSKGVGYCYLNRKGISALITANSIARYSAMVLCFYNCQFQNKVSERARDKPAHFFPSTSIRVIKSELFS